MQEMQNLGQSSEAIQEMEQNLESAFLDLSQNLKLLSKELNELLQKDILKPSTIVKH